MDVTEDRIDEGLASSLAERGMEVEARLAEVEAAMASAARGVASCERLSAEGTNVAVELIGDVARHDRLRSELATVRRAEAKLALGSQGRCDGCGQAIAPERLEVLPWAVHCVECAG